MLRYYAKVSTLSAEERAAMKAQQGEQQQKELAASREAQRERQQRIRAADALAMQSIGSSTGCETGCAHGPTPAGADVCRWLYCLINLDEFDKSSGLISIHSSASLQ